MDMLDACGGRGATLRDGGSPKWSGDRSAVLTASVHVTEAVGVTPDMWQHGLHVGDALSMQFSMWHVSNGGVFMTKSSRVVYCSQGSEPAGVWL